MINKPHAVAVRLTIDEYLAITHISIRDGDKNLTATLRKVLEPLIEEGNKSLQVEHKKYLAKLKRQAKKEASSGL